MDQPTITTTTASQKHDIFTLQTCSPYKVANALSSINPQKTKGEAGLDLNLLRLAAPVILEHIPYIFYLSVLSWIPSIWKTAHVIPLRGDAADLNNYRPISTKSCLSKILESLVNNQLKSFLYENSVLSNYQSGFRERHSTISATMLVWNDLNMALDGKKFCAAIFIDLTKAFDTVDLDVLLDSLHKIGFSNNALRWAQDHLSGRKQ